MIDPRVAALDADPSVMLALLVKRIERPEEVEDTSVVKAVFDARGTRALLQPLAHPVPEVRRRRMVQTHRPLRLAQGLPARFRRVGADSARKTESLEMLRVLERGHTIRCVEALRDTIESTLRTIS